MRAVRANESLLASWRSFVEALRVHDGYDVGREDVGSSSTEARGEGWWIAKIELDRESRDLLRPAIAGRRNLITLILDDNHFGSDGGAGVDFLCDILEESPHLARVSFDNNPMLEGTDDALLGRLCEAVRAHPSLEHLTLENAGLGGDEVRLSIILEACGKLACLGLSGNGFGSSSRGADSEIVARFLASAETKIIYLRDNDFGDESADLFASALRSDNARPRVLDLSRNRFTKSGGLAVLDAVFDASSPNAAADSNHACAVYVDKTGMSGGFSIINRQRDPDANRRNKVLTVLFAAAAAGEKLGQLLEDVPLGLMPDVLEYVQGCAPRDIPREMKKHAMESLQEYAREDYEEAFSRQTTLTVVFEVLRSWDLPSLYSNL